MKNYLLIGSLLLVNAAVSFYNNSTVMEHMAVTQEKLDRTEHAAVAAQADREFQTLGHYSPGKFCVIAATPDVDEDEFSRLALGCSRKHLAYLMAQEAIKAQQAGKVASE